MNTTPITWTVHENGQPISGVVHPTRMAAMNEAIGLCSRVLGRHVTLRATDGTELLASFTPSQAAAALAKPTGLLAPALRELLDALKALETAIGSVAATAARDRLLAARTRGEAALASFAARTPSEW
jgi:hypothetical protein